MEKEVKEIIEQIDALDVVSDGSTGTLFVRGDLNNVTTSVMVKGSKDVITSYLFHNPGEKEELIRILRMPLDINSQN